MAQTLPQTFIVKTDRGYTHPYACAGSGVDQILPYSKRGEQSIADVQKVRKHEIKYLQDNDLNALQRRASTAKIDPRAEKERVYLTKAKNAQIKKHALQDQQKVNIWVAPAEESNDLKALQLHLKLLNEKTPPVDAVRVLSLRAQEEWDALNALELSTEQWEPPRAVRANRDSSQLPGLAVLAEKEFIQSEPFKPYTKIAALDSDERKNRSKEGSKDKKTRGVRKLIR